MTLTVGSLFSGIGGIDLGLERAGMRILWQVEIDAYAQKVLAKHWPEVPRHGDIREVRPEGLPRVDVLAGGFPCQDISVAGKGAGLQGARSGLWAEFARCIRALQPRYVLVENVAALTHRGLGRILGELAACGYDAEWDCLPAAALGAPHLRDRLFVVAYSNSHRVRHQPERHQPHQAQRRHALVVDDGQARNVAHAHGGGFAELRTAHHPAGQDAPGDVPGGCGENEAHAGRVLRPDALARARGEALARVWGAEPDVCRVAHGIPSRVDRLRGLGNAVVPQVAEYVGRCIVAHAEAMP